MAQESGSLPLKDPYPQPVPKQISLFNGGGSSGDSDVSMEDGALKIRHPDGSVTIDWNPQPTSQEKGGDDFSRNLAIHMEDADLDAMATDLLDGIQRDEDSRKDWLETRSRGIKLLGLKIEDSRTDVTSGPLEGMSTVRHPLLLEATTTFQATARAELLPSSGPVKVRNDSPSPPQSALQDTSATQQLADSLQGKDELAQALEKDMNHYLTSTAPEYIPDTDRMLFYIGFGGDGFKKVYNCPLRRRPTSESVDAEDLIVSDAATDIQNCGRVTHKMKMRKSVLKRMQILGAYRDVELAPPPVPRKTPVDETKEELSGHRPDLTRPEDRDYIIYETYCELDLDEFAPKQFKGEGLPLPYKVTLEKESRKILDIRRNWKEDDDQCMPKQFFVQFPFIRGLGFYGLGYIHLLGNTTNSLTAAWRLMLDAGMFGNFPGFLYSKGAGRQLSNQVRVAPGTGVGMDIGATQNIRDAIMPLPYKEAGPAFTAFITHVEEIGRRLASTANINVGEGKQDAPVGTTLALIEQASKLMDSAHKRLHAAQAQEFALLKERFKEDPESFWRHNKRPTIQWEKDQFLQALNSCELVPVADPNNPTSLHRLAKAMTIKELQKASPDLYDPVAVDMRIMRIADIDPQGLFRAQPAPQPPDPRMVAIQAKQQAEQTRNQIQYLETQIKAAQAQADLQDKAEDRASRERIEQMKIQLEMLRIQEEQIIHANDEQRNQVQFAHNLAMEHASKGQELQHKAIERSHDLHFSNLEAQHELQGGRIQSQHDIEMERERHHAEMQRAHEEHQLKMEHMRELHQHKLEAAKQLARAKPKPTTTKKKD
jgi:hypothetical protein